MRQLEKRQIILLGVLACVIVAFASDVRVEHDGTTSVDRSRRVAAATGR